MANIGTFIVLDPAPATPSSGGGGEGGMVVSVPGNAAEIVARATGSALTITAVNDNTVQVTFPAVPTGAADMQDFAIDMLRIFGAAEDPAIGWFTVTAKGMIGLADSSDPGVRPDYIPVVGTVTFAPNFTKPIRILSSGTFFSVGAVQATFDSDGELSFDGEKTVRLIAPTWADLSKKDWRWTAQVRPGPGQNWQGWDASFTANPGETVDLSSFI